MARRASLRRPDCSCPVASLASIHPRNRYLLHRAAHGVPEIDFDLIFEVRARFAFRFRNRAAASAKKLAEEIAETRSAGARTTAEIKATKIEIHSGLTRALPSSRIAARRQVVAVEAILVVHLPLLRVREDVVGFLDFLEFFFGSFIAGIQVRVILARQLAERRANILQAGLARHSQHFVII